MVKPYSKYLEIVGLLNKARNIIICTDEIEVGIEITKSLIHDGQFTFYSTVYLPQFNNKILLGSDVEFIGMSGELDKDKLEFISNSNKNFIYILESEDTVSDRFLLDKCNSLSLNLEITSKIKDIEYNVINVYDGFGDIFIKELRW